MKETEQGNELRPTIITPEVQQELDALLQTLEGSEQTQERVRPLYDFYTKYTDIPVDPSIFTHKINVMHVHARLESLLGICCQEKNIPLMKRLGESYSRTESATFTGISLSLCCYDALKNKENGLEAIKILVSYFNFDVFHPGFLLSALQANHEDIIRFLLEGVRGVDPAKVIPASGGMSLAARPEMDFFEVRWSTQNFSLLREAALRQFDKYKDDQLPADYSGFECDTMSAIRGENQDKLKENLLLALRLTRDGDDFPFPLRKEVLQAAVVVLDAFSLSSSSAVDFLTKKQNKLTGKCLLFYCRDLYLTGNIAQAVGKEILADVDAIKIIDDTNIESVIAALYQLYLSSAFERSIDFVQKIVRKIDINYCCADRLKNLFQMISDCGWFYFLNRAGDKIISNALADIKDIHGFSLAYYVKRFVNLVPYPNLPAHMQLIAESEDKMKVTFKGLQDWIKAGRVFDPGMPVTLFPENERSRVVEFLMTHGEEPTAEWLDTRKYVHNKDVKNSVIETAIKHGWWKLAFDALAQDPVFFLVEGCFDKILQAANYDLVSVKDKTGASVIDIFVGGINNGIRPASVTHCLKSLNDAVMEKKIKAEDIKQLFLRPIGNTTFGAMVRDKMFNAEKEYSALFEAVAPQARNLVTVMRGSVYGSAGTVERSDNLSGVNVARMDL